MKLNDWTIGLVGLVCVTMGVFAQAQTPDSVNILTSEFIYEEPGPTPSCHASTICVTREGSLVAAWFGGTHENNPDVGIWFASREASGWSEPIEIVDGVQGGKRYPCWNPVLFQPANGKTEAPLLLFYKVGPSPSTWWGMLMTSDDEGKTWSEPVRLPEGIAGPIKNKPFELEDGTLLCPTSSEDDGWRVHFEMTSDLGKTWTRTEALNDGTEIGAIQPSILRLDNGTLRALGRTRQERVFQIDSEDNGKTWGPMTLTDLPNPNSGTDAITLADGRHLLVYNNTEKGRSPLNLAVSEDGETWKDLLVLESEPGEYSYPAIIQASDGTVHITYTWNRKKIRYVALVSRP
jgi:predicted neuraminidase